MTLSYCAKKTYCFLVFITGDAIETMLLVASCKFIATRCYWLLNLNLFVTNKMRPNRVNQIQAISITVKNFPKQLQNVME